MTDRRVIDNAVLAAITGHWGQVDRSEVPYILHPMRVMHKVAGQVAGMWDAHIIMAAAVLHDVVEDTSIGYQQLKSIYQQPDRVIELLTLLTHVKEGSTNREKDASYRKYIERVHTDEHAIIIKLADLNDNLFHPARRQGWKGHEAGKRRYLKSWFYLTEHVWE